MIENEVLIHIDKQLVHAHTKGFALPSWESQQDMNEIQPLKHDPLLSHTLNTVRQDKQLVKKNHN